MYWHYITLYDILNQDLQISKLIIKFSSRIFFNETLNVSDSQISTQLFLELSRSFLLEIRFFYSIVQ